MQADKDLDSQDTPSAFQSILKAQAPRLTLGKRTEQKQEPKQQQNVTANTLNELDLDKELLDQYKAAKGVFDDIKNDESIAANQKAQVINSIQSILQSIVKTQQELHSVERLKLIENTLIETLQKHETLKDAFLKDYTEALEKVK